MEFVSHYAYLPLSYLLHRRSQPLLLLLGVPLPLFQGFDRTEIYGGVCHALRQDVLTLPSQLRDRFRGFDRGHFSLSLPISPDEGFLALPVFRIS